LDSQQESAGGDEALPGGTDNRNHGSRLPNRSRACGEISPISFVYLAWMGLLSDGLSRSLASVEVSIHRKLSLFHGRRWNNVMFLARKEIGR
jgi:hypothetical protein